MAQRGFHARWTGRFTAPVARRRPLSPALCLISCHSPHARPDSCGAPPRASWRPILTKSQSACSCDTPMLWGNRATQPPSPQDAHAPCATLQGRARPSANARQDLRECEPPRRPPPPCPLAVMCSLPTLLPFAATLRVPYVMHPALVPQASHGLFATRFLGSCPAPRKPSCSDCLVHQASCDSAHSDCGKAACSSPLLAPPAQPGHGSLRLHYSPVPAPLMRMPMPFC